MRKSDKEITEIKKQNVFIVEKLLVAGKLSKEDINEQFSGIMHLNHIETFAWDWVPKDVINRLEINVEEAKRMTLEEYAQKHVHPITIKTLTPLFLGALNGTKKMPLDVFQYIKLNEEADYNWINTTCSFSFKLGKIVAVSHFVKDLYKDVSDEEKVLGEYHFIRKNYNKFLQLTRSQKKILRLLALGYTSQMIASELQISPHTVKAHRNAIHQTLDLRWKNINHSQEYVKYAIHFGLIHF